MPGPRVNQAKLLSSSLSSVTCHFAGGRLGCRISTRLPTASGPPSSRRMLVTVGVHSRQRSISRITAQTLSGGASISNCKTEIQHARELPTLSVHQRFLGPYHGQTADVIPKCVCAGWAAAGLNLKATGWAHSVTVRFLSVNGFPIRLPPGSLIRVYARIECLNAPSAPSSMASFSKFAKKNTSSHKTTCHLRHRLLNRIPGKTGPLRTLPASVGDSGRPRASPDVLARLSLRCEDLPRIDSSSRHPHPVSLPTARLGSWR